MIYRKRRKKIEEPNHILQESTQFLGITLHSKLTWEELLTELKTKAKRAFNKIQVVTGKK